MRQLGFVLYLIIVVCLLGEAIFWLLPEEKKKPPYDTAVRDPLLGWKPKPNYSFEGPMQSLDGTEYEVSFTTQNNGFRHFAKVRDTSRTGLLLIGDSYTQAVEVSDDKTFYQYVAYSLGWQVYAFGMAGYGTLQELFILESYLDMVQPDWILLQFCSNDFIDNDHQLEKNADYHVGLRRPYYTLEEELVYAHPEGRLVELVERTRFLRYLRASTLSLWGSRQKSDDRIRSEEKITRGKVNDEDYARSLKVTQLLLERIKHRLSPEQTLAVFSADRFEPQYSDFKEICDFLDILFIPFPNAEFYEMRQDREVYAHDGYHWNELGHRLIGQQLVKVLGAEERKLVAAEN